jgi:hypothetical protein
MLAAQGLQLFLRGPPTTQVLWVQAGQEPQSAAQVSQVSLGAQTPLPQVPLQSPGQLAFVSPQSHLPLPQEGPHCPQAGGPQSFGHEQAVSPGSQTLLPQKTFPQSWGQV